MAFYSDYVFEYMALRAWGEKKKKATPIVKQLGLRRYFNHSMHNHMRIKPGATTCHHSLIPGCLSLRLAS